MTLVHWPLMGGLLHLVQQEEDWVGPQSPPRCTKCNSTVLLYNGPLLCGFNVPIKGLNQKNNVLGYSIDSNPSAIQVTGRLLYDYTRSVAYSVTVYVRMRTYCKCANTTYTLSVSSTVLVAVSPTTVVTWSAVVVSNEGGRLTALRVAIIHDRPTTTRCRCYAPRSPANTACQQNSNDPHAQHIQKATALRQH